MAIDGGMNRARQAVEDPFRAAGDVGRGVITAVQACDLQRRVRVERRLGPGLVHCGDGVAREGVRRVRLEEPVFLEPALRVAAGGVRLGDSRRRSSGGRRRRGCSLRRRRGSAGRDRWRGRRRRKFWPLKRVEHGVHGGAEFLGDVGAVFRLGFPEVEAHVVALRGFVVPEAGVAGHVQLEAGVVRLVEDREDGGVEFCGKVVLDLVRGV